MQFLTVPARTIAELSLQVEGGYERAPSLIGDDKYYGITSDRWVAQLRTAPLKPSKRVEFEAFLEGLQGPTNMAQIIDYRNRHDIALYWPTITAIQAGTYTPQIGVATVPGSEFITLQNLNEPNTTEIARPGALLSITRADGIAEMYKVRLPAVVNSNSAQLSIWPRVRSIHAVGSAVEILNPVVSLRLVTSTRQAQTLRDETVVYTMELREARISV